MKRSLLIAIVSLMILVIVACNGGDLSEEQTSVREIIDSEDIQIKLTIEAQRYGGPYQAKASIKGLSADIAADKFNNAQILVNGQRLGLVRSRDRSKFYDGQFIYQGPDLWLRAGDLVLVSLEHPELGIVKEELQVPEPLDSLELRGKIDNWLSGEVEEITLEWPATNSEYYRVQVTRYSDAYREYSTANQIIEANRYDLVDRNWSRGYDHSLQKEVKASYIELEVSAAKVVKLSEFAAGSRLELLAPEAKSISNLPEEID